MKGRIVLQVVSLILACGIAGLAPGPIAAQQDEDAAPVPEALLSPGIPVEVLAYRLVPRNLVDRPKRGFGIPLAAWLRGPLREVASDLLLDHTARQRGWFKHSFIQRLLNEHASGVDLDRQIWPLLMIETWARRWLDPIGSR